MEGLKICRRLIVGIATAGIITLAAGVYPHTIPAASAAGMCQDNGAASNVFDGTVQETTTYGAYANLDSQVGPLCTTGNSASASTAWAMLSGGSIANDGYAQSGIVNQRDQPQANIDYYFYQWAKRNPATYPGEPYYEQDPGTVTGSHNYQETYNFSTGHIEMYYDSTKLAETNFDPAVSWSPSWWNQWNGEVGDPQDDMPGTSAAPEHFRYLGYIPCRGCAMQTPSSLTLSSGSSRFHYQWVTTNYNFNIWTG